MDNPYRLVAIPVFKDDRGMLSFIENGAACPFEIQRAYWLFNSNQQLSRGHHAHKELKQLVICITGSVSITLDNGQSKDTLILSSPDQGLYIDGFIWRELHDFKDNPVILVLCSDQYSEDDYVRDYDEFKKIARTLS